ncbi:MAG: hypothetical protein WCD18_28375 [Thermosynechococcaceae cyanobacterium]
MKNWSRCFGQLLQADCPRERALSFMLVILAIAYVGLTWAERSPACAGKESINQGLPLQFESVSCE